MKAKAYVHHVDDGDLLFSLDYKGKQFIVLAKPYESDDEPVKDAESYQIQVIAQDYDVRWPTSEDDENAPYWAGGYKPARQDWIAQQLVENGVLRELAKECVG